MGDALRQLKGVIFEVLDLHFYAIMSHDCMTHESWLSSEFSDYFDKYNLAKSALLYLQNCDSNHALFQG